MIPAYSHDGLIRLIIDNPTWTHKQYAQHFGRPASWFAAVLATDDFQLALDPHRAEITDPSITATMEERLRALALRSMSVLQHKMESGKVADFTVIKAMENSTKALGMGTTSKRQEGGEKLPNQTIDLAGNAAFLVDRMRKTGAGRLSQPIEDVEIIEKEK
jgi:hypothetical protein